MYEWLILRLVADWRMIRLVRLAQLARDWYLMSAIRGIIAVCYRMSTPGSGY